MSRDSSFQLTWAERQELLFKDEKIKNLFDTRLKKDEKHCFIIFQPFLRDKFKVQVSMVEIPVQNDKE